MPWPASMAEVAATTKRLILRDWEPADEAAFYDIMNTFPVMEHLGGLQTRDEWNAGYQRLRDYQRDDGHTFWIVEDKESRELLGFCGLKRANAPGASFHGAMEIGWRLRESAWGKGIAKEAAIASLDIAFDRFRSLTVVAPTSRANIASQGLMKRLGMIRRDDLDYIDTRFPQDSDINPQIVHSIDATEWPAARVRALA